MSRFCNWTRRLAAASIVGVFVLFCASVNAEVWTTPAPEGQAIENAYHITVDGKPVDVYRSFDQEEGSGEYYFASFEFTDKVKIEITAPFSLANATVAPERFGVKTLALSEKSATLEADKPFQISFEPNGRVKPLILFGLAPEVDAPHEGDPNVVYFGPGVHTPNVINLTDNQTLYIAAGAVVNGGVRAEGKNITIRGRGVLAGTNWERFKGPCGFLIDCHNCENVVVRDVIMRDPWSWTCTFWNCNGVTIDGVRIVASNMINDDALDLCNVQNAVVKNCFFRAQDDSVAIKGQYKNGAPCENILVEDCVFWTDRANVFRVGYECQAEAMRNIVAKNIDVLYYSINYRDPEEYWANAIIWLQPNLEMPMYDCRFENFRVRSNGDDMIMLEARPMSCTYGEFQNPTPGTIKNCSLTDFTVYGERGKFVGLLYIKGPAENCDVDGLTVKNFDYFGEKIKKDSSCVKISGFTKNVSIE